MLRKTLTLLFLVFTFVSSFAQNELMIYGSVQTIENSVEGARLKVELVEEYKTIIDRTLTVDGQYRIDLQYGKTYIVSFTKPGYTPMVFDVNLKMPEGVKQCCYRPIKLSFHLFKPDGENDDLFEGTFLVLQYEKQFNGFNYDLDIDYMVQQRIVQSQIFKQKQLEAREGNKLRSDSVQNEKHYLALINQGTLFYNNKQFYSARKLFLEAQKLKPNRMYPHYKLEDIRTELERFETKANLLGVNVDSIIEQELAQIEVKDEMPVYPAYKPLTQEQVDEIFKKDIEKQVIAASETPEEANRTLAMMNEFFEEEFEQVQVADFQTKDSPEIANEPESEIVNRTVDLLPPTTTDPEPKVGITEKDIVAEQPKVQPTDTITIAKVEETTAATNKETKDKVDYKPISHTETKPEPKPVAKTETPKVVDFRTYQDSLMEKYPEPRTIEVTQNSYKKTTRVFMNNGKTVEVYTKVEHSWGATYYYLEEYPTGYQNIGYSAFMNKTKLYEIEEGNN